MKSKPLREPCCGAMQPREQVLRYRVYDGLTSLPAAYVELARAAVSACAGSYAPYSSYHVGAAVRLDSGVVVLGANQENAAYPSGLCAERVALFSAFAQHPGAELTMLAVAAMRDGALVECVVTPCGACRQVLLEYCSRSDRAVPVIMVARQQAVVVDDARELLPLAFELE